jgi:pseudo-rSAM protein
MKKYWFYLEPFTFIFLQKEKILIYNSLSNKGNIFKNSNYLKEIILRLQNLDNMYCIEITEKELEVNDIKGFVDFVRNSFSGDLINSSVSKPAIFPPILNLQNNVKRLNSFQVRSVSEEIFYFLDEVSIYLGGQSPLSSLNEIDVYKQFDYCKKNEGKYLAFKEFKSFFQSFQNCGSLERINILGGNIFCYPDLILLIEELSMLPAKKVVYSTYADIPNKIESYSFLNNNLFSVKVLIDFPIIKKALEETFNLLTRNGISYDCLFAVTSKDEFEQVEFLVNKYDLDQYEIKPVFTGQNIDFFKEYIFLSEEDILQTQTTRREIFIKRSLNVFNFGKLRIMENGKIYSDVNSPSIGKVNMPLVEVLNKEMCKPKSWLRVRNQEPCNKCVYQWLCPSPSGYEHVIGKSNLCLAE